MRFSPLKDFRSYRLPNGLALLLKQDDSWPVVSAHAWVRVGSVDEADTQAGISHVLEHMVFKGTARHRALDISRWVEALGGSLNAETSKEYTHYYIDVPSAGARKAVHLLGELLHRATIDPEEWRRERPVILEEIKRRNDDPDALLWDLLNEAMFDDVRWRRPVIGFPESVSALDHETLARFYHKEYTAAQSLVVIVGDFKSREMLDWLRQAFADMPAGDPKPERHPAPVTWAPRHKDLRKPVKQSYLAFGFPTPPSTHPDQEALDVIAAILGEGRGSRLVHTLREEKKIVWSVSAANLTQEGPGIFGIFVECDPKRRGQLVPALDRLLAHFRHRPPTSAELTRAKNMIQTSWLQSFETCHGQASTVGLFALEKHLDRLEGYLPKVLALTRDQIQNVILRYFGALSLSSAAIEA